MKKITIALFLSIATFAWIAATNEQLPRARPLTGIVFARTPERLNRGKYLVNGPLECFLCHSDRDWKKHGAPPIAGKIGAGSIFHNEKDYVLAAPNITPDRETGAGTWTDDMFARAIREGIGHDGRALHPQMWYDAFKNLSDEDLASVVVYIRSIPAVKNLLPKRHLTAENEQRILGAPQPLTHPQKDVDPKDLVGHGAYLARIADCMGCHTSWYTKVNPGNFGGGNLIERGPIKVFSVNITMDPSGISYYDEALFIEVMRTGKVKSRELSAIMPWIAYRNMSDHDLKALFSFLKYLHPVHHEIENSSPPTLCPLCGQKHGAGENNVAFSPKAVKVDPKILATYAGTYRELDGFEDTFVVENGTLKQVHEDGSKEEIIPVSQTEFVTPNFATPIQFLKNDKGQIYFKGSTPFDPGLKVK